MKRIRIQRFCAESKLLNTTFNQHNPTTVFVNLDVIGLAVVTRLLSKHGKKTLNMWNSVDYFVNSESYHFTVTLYDRLHMKKIIRLSPSFTLN